MGTLATTRHESGHTILVFNDTSDQLELMGTVLRKMREVLDEPAAGPPD